MDPRALADEDLMPLLRRADPRPFEVLFERDGTAPFSLAYLMLASRAAAAGVLEEVFLGIWRAGARYDPARGSVRTWILGIVHHRAIDALRRAYVHDRRRMSDEGLEERLEAPERTEAEAARREEARGIHSALGTLPREQARVIELAYFGGFTHTEIAAMLEAPVGTVKGRMRLGLAKMRDQLEGI